MEQLASYLEWSPLIWMMLLDLHVKSNPNDVVKTKALSSYRAADLHLCFPICKRQVFS